MSLTRARARARQRERAAAGAQIGDARRHAAGQQLQPPLHQQLGFRTRHQHSRRDVQAQRPEALVAGQVGHRRAGRAALAQGHEARLCIGRQRVGVVRQQPGAAGAGTAQGMQQQQLGVDARQAQRLRGGQGLGQGGSSCHYGFNSC